MNIIHGKHGLREALHHAVVGNGNGTVPHAVCHFTAAAGSQKPSMLLSFVCK